MPSQVSRDQARRERLGADAYEHPCELCPRMSLGVTELDARRAYNLHKSKAHGARRGESLLKPNRRHDFDSSAVLERLSLGIARHRRTA